MARLAALIPSPLRPFARKVRDHVRAWERAPVEVVLQPTDCQAVVEPVSPVVLLQRRTTTPCPVRVRNLGSAVWSSNGRNPVHLTLRWLTPQKDAIEAPAAKFRLPAPVYPGQSVVVPASLTAPDFLGHYLIEADLAQDGGAAFAAHGSRPGLIEAQVTGRDADDIDYHKAYATADLTRDYWTVVGPSTKDEFDRLGQAKLDLLRRAGLTPDGRVLDVGCGTGQLATPLESFLSDRGCYYGTDIGPEAVAFCQKQFKRSNFRFARNDMTTVPITGMEFDFVTFFSVFTHTFPDETVLLLAEANRLLAPGGVVIGDVFTSPMVERSAGNRGAMELNRDHFLKLVALAGLKAEVTDSWPWQKYGRREVFSFTRAAAGAEG